MPISLATLASLNAPKTVRRFGGFEAVITCMIICLTVFWWRSPGTGDTAIYLKAMDVLDSSGLIDGYRLSRKAVQYPPLSTIVLYVAKQLEFGWFSDLAMLKLALVAFQAAAWRWVFRATHSLRRSLLFVLATVISTVGLGYLDMLLAAPIIATMYFCRKRRFVWATIAFLVAILMKWQPLILFPGFVGFALLTLHPRRLEWSTIIACVTLTVFILVAFLWIFGRPFMASLYYAFSQQGWLLSGNGANPFYLVTEALTIGSGSDNPFVTNVGFPYLWPWVKYPFYCAAVLAFALYLQVEKTVENLVIFSVMFFWIYYLLAPGVHENHLALAVFIAFTLSGNDRAERWIIGLTAFAFNLNLATFYDFQLLTPYLTHLPVWLTLAIRGGASLINTAAGSLVIFLCVHTLLRCRKGNWEGVLVKSL